MSQPKSICSTRVTLARLTLIAAALALAIASPGTAQPPDKPDKPAAQPDKPDAKPAKADIYDTKADAKAVIAAAVEKAKAENQRVLIMFGGNWCGWCHKLHELFKSNPDIAKALSYEYQLVMVDIGQFDKNMDIAAMYGADLTAKDTGGVPYLVVLGPDGKALTAQPTGPLEEGNHHNPKKVAEFLDKWKAEPVDAEKLYKQTLEQAAKDKKLVFVHLGAPWCPWCHKLDDFLARKDIAEIIGRDFINVKIDVDRMTNGKDVARKLRKNEKVDIPWFVFLDADGKALADSDGPKGNIGYPSAPEEIEHFVGMLKKTAKRITAEQIGEIEKALKEPAKPKSPDRAATPAVPSAPAQPSTPPKP